MKICLSSEQASSQEFKVSLKEEKELNEFYSFLEELVETWDYASVESVTLEVSDEEIFTLRSVCRLSFSDMLGEINQLSDGGILIKESGEGTIYLMQQLAMLMYALANYYITRKDINGILIPRMFNVYNQATGQQYLI
jgi:seryl-tRNA synthetase